jgi:hypothetical protein
MSKINSRRTFISQSALGAAALTSGSRFIKAEDELVTAAPAIDTSKHRVTLA